MIQISTRAQRPFLYFVSVLITICIVATSLSRNLSVIERLLIVSLFFVLNLCLFVILLTRFYEVFYDKEKDLFILKSSFFCKEVIVNANELVKITKYKKNQIAVIKSVPETYRLYFNASGKEKQIYFIDSATRDTFKYFERYYQE